MSEHTLQDSINEMNRVHDALNADRERAERREADWVEILGVIDRLVKGRWDDSNDLHSVVTRAFQAGYKLGSENTTPKGE
jgi:hypothetical protein